VVLKKGRTFGSPRSRYDHDLVITENLNLVDKYYQSGSKEEEETLRRGRWGRVVGGLVIQSGGKAIIMAVQEME